MNFLSDPCFVALRHDVTRFWDMYAATSGQSPEKGTKQKSGFYDEGSFLITFFAPSHHSLPTYKIILKIYKTSVVLGIS